MRSGFGIMALATVWAWSAPTAAIELSADEIAERLGFSADDKAKLQAGEIVSAEIEETTAKQLAVVIALQVPAGLDDIAARVTEGTTLEANPSIQAFGRIDPAQVNQAAFAGITLGGDEIEQLLEVEPGSTFNLSSAEIATFQDLARQYRADDPGAAEAVNAAWRQMLAGRVQAYLEGGLDGIAPYDRGDGEVSSAADDLRAAAEGSLLLQQAVPDLYQAFVAYPNEGLADVEHEFFWTEQLADDRPVHLLTHRMVQRRPDVLVVLSRDFYVGHSFNASQAVAGALPVDGGVVVFYANRTSTDQVAGFMSSMRHEVGRGMMRDSLVEALEEIRAAWPK